MEIRLYTPEYKSLWDTFVRNSKNGTFLFCRDFMEYHGPRFNDYSLMFFINERLVALMPGHISDKVFYTHQGLTYGGLVMNEETTSVEVLSIFEYLTVTFKHQGIKKIIYKAIPHIYHRLPAEEDLYALFRYKAILSERNISSTILLSERLRYSDSRKNGIKKATKNKLKVEESNDLKTFWEILTHNLTTKYNRLPVHSLSEIVYLKGKFPDEIRLYAVLNKNNCIIGGCLTFEMQHIIHVQYTAATEDGKSMGAIDLVVDYMINTACSGKKYFDYGISTEDNGSHLNESLVYQKEGFGARGTVYDIYTIEL